MSRLTDNFFKMYNMKDDELRKYIKTLKESDKNIILYSIIKTMQKNKNSKSSMKE